MSRRITGIQTHHSLQLDDASRGATNMCVSLGGAVRKTGDPELADLQAEAVLLTRRIGRAREAANARLHGFYAEDPERFKRARAGAEPYPDETVGGFVARCTCYDLCLHRYGIEPGENGICNCDGVKPPCPAHPDPTGRARDPDHR